MAVFKAKEKTKDGREWVFKTYYDDLKGNRKQYYSKRFLTKKEAQEEERKFLMGLGDIQDNSMTIEDLYYDYYNHQKDRVKKTSLMTYEKRFNQIESLSKIKVKDFSIKHFNQWKKEYDKNDKATSYKNSIYKFIRSLLTFANKYHEFDFGKPLLTMSGFNDKNEVKKEMEFWAYDEFKQFLSVEENLTYKTFWQTLYYCGLRLGEAKALNWNDIDFENKTVRINKSLSGKIKGQKFVITTPKTKSSIRTIPMPSNLLNSLKTLKEQQKTTTYKFSADLFVFGGEFPLSDTTIQKRKDKNCNDSEVKRIRIHDFRHSTASLLINNGANIVLVAKYLGHAKIDMTLNTYSHLYKNQMEEIVELIEKL